MSQECKKQIEKVQQEIESELYKILSNSIKEDWDIEVIESNKDNISEKYIVKTTKGLEMSQECKKQIEKVQQEIESELYKILSNSIKEDWEIEVIESNKDNISEKYIVKTKRDLKLIITPPLPIVNINIDF